MKLNWGTSIVIAFGLFMSFILFFVFKVQGNPKYDNELVVEEYYKRDAKYGDEMKKVQNAYGLQQLPSISELQQGIVVTFPKYFNPEKVSGEVSFYRPSDKKLDFKLVLKLSGHSQLIPKSDFAGGLWDISLNWKYAGKDYLIKQEMYLK